MRLRPAIFAILCNFSNCLTYSQTDFSVSRASIFAFDPPSAGTNGNAIVRWPANSGGGNWTGTQTGATSLTLPSTTTSYTVAGFEAGKVYELALRKLPTATETTGTIAGHIAYGVEIPLDEVSKSCLVLCEQNLSDVLGGELKNYVRDLEAEGWSVWFQTVKSTDSPVLVRDKIAAHTATLGDLSHILLLGHVPVPYSGGRGFYPDGHTEHQGVWPCDGFYADAKADTSLWPDTASFTTTYSYAKSNLPGDGRFDRTNFPSTLEYCVGRVDLSRMPAFTAAGVGAFDAEVALMRRYFTKANQFRQGRVAARRKVVINDGLSTNANFTEGPAKGIYRSYGPAFGANAFEAGGWEAQPQQNLVGAGIAFGQIVDGNFSSFLAGTSQGLAAGQLNSVFNHMFGSYFGDWDNTNNLLRATIASRGISLCTLWDGRPSYEVHHLAIGKTIGHAVKFSMNTSASSGYDPGISARGVHMGLMGDPTLTLFPVPTPVAAQALLGGTVTAPVAQLTWLSQAALPGEPPVAGYHIYKSLTPGDPFIRITPNLLTVRSFSDTAVNAYSRYQIKAVRLETTPSGSFWNASAGAVCCLMPGAVHPVELWKFSKFGASYTQQSDSADPDKDGLSNLLEFATVTNPLVANAAQITPRMSSGQLEIDFPEPTWCPVTLALEQSTDLSRWVAVTVSGITSTKPGWTVRRHCVAPQNMASRPQLYFRLRAVR